MEQFDFKLEPRQWTQYFLLVPVLFLLLMGRFMIQDGRMLPGSLLVLGGILLALLFLYNINSPTTVVVKGAKVQWKCRGKVQEEIDMREVSYIFFYRVYKRQNIF